MHKGKSLSDSSTSESDDDGNRHQQKSAFSNAYPRKNLGYSGMPEEEDFSNQNVDVFSGQKIKFPTQVVKPQNKGNKRKLPDHELGDAIKSKQSRTVDNFKAPVRRNERDSSTSESEEDLGRRRQTSLASSSSDDCSKFIKGNGGRNAVEQHGSMAPGNFKMPKGMREIDSSASESDDDFGKKGLMSGQPFSCASESSDLSSADSPAPSFGSTIDMEVKVSNQADSALYAGIGRKLMSKMGWTDGKGLGKHGQGRTEIVEASKQRGRRGLGLHIKGLEQADVKWNSEIEKESVDESVAWLPECTEEPLSLSELREWIKLGKKKLVIDDETNFCDPELLKNVLTYKNVFDELEPEEMRKARTRSNPFETIRGGIFLNRAAMKMANMDSCFDFMFSDPKDQHGMSMVAPDELLYFADVCAGPGGFSEYILWRKKWESKGFGFTLRGQNDFKLDEFFSGPPETFEPHYGLDGDGNIYTPHNLREFRRFVLNNTDNKGVHFVMADGGFSVEGQENIQEILSKRLYLCQFLCALLIVRPGGHFICKLFDLFTPFSVGLVYLMYRTFEKVCLFKPNTSRPANSERYIVCKWRRENTKDICDYMNELNDTFDSFSATAEEDIVEIVPMDVLQDDKDFLEYIIESNNMFAERQVVHLDKIRAFVRNNDLHEHLQGDFRKKCLAVWQVPDQVRQAPSRPEPTSRFKELMKGESHSYFQSEPKALTAENLRQLSNIFNFKCIVCGEIGSTSYRGYFLGLGRSNIYRLDFKTSKWMKIEVSLELPADTLLYGELIPELKGEGKAQKKIMCLQVIDVLFLGGRDVRKCHFEVRMCLARKLAKAVSKPSRADYTPVKVKKIWELMEIDDILSRLMMKNVKGYGGTPRLCFDTEDERHFIPSGLLIFDTVAHPWVTAYSKSQKRIYYFNTKNKESIFEQDDRSIATFRQTFENRIFWNWERGVQLLPQQRVEVVKSVVHGKMFQAFLEDKLIAQMKPMQCG